MSIMPCQCRCCRERRDRALSDELIATLTTPPSPTPRGGEWVMVPRELADEVRIELRSNHGELDHDFEKNAKACPRCKLRRRFAETLAAPNRPAREVGEVEARGWALESVRDIYGDSGMPEGYRYVVTSLDGTSYYAETLLEAIDALTAALSAQRAGEGSD